MAAARFEGKVAIVTGGGTGIGAATARRIAAEGGKVLVTGRRPEPLNAVADEIGGAALAGDATDPAHLEAAAALAVERFGGIDILVANAATGSFGSVAEVGVEDWREVFRLNVEAPMLATKVVLPHLQRRGGGAIVLVGSIASLRAAPRFAAYMSSKTALLGLNRSIALDYGPAGIRCNVICPALIRTDMAEGGINAGAAMKGCSPDDMLNAMVGSYPLQRIGEPDEIGGAIAFLASDDSSFITGAAIAADGGASIVDITALAF
ncbi:MAG TPA: glucose 1-dehydrogenase [Allosphingosinicella sp.]|nr:glucose 1-dehydrogenase [Allosphingosinicella sp.]